MLAPVSNVEENTTEEKITEDLINSKLNEISLLVKNSNNIKYCEYEYLKLKILFNFSSNTIVNGFENGTKITSIISNVDSKYHIKDLRLLVDKYN